MLRHRRFLILMHRLALMGALLMAIAPVVSRWLMSQPADDVSAAPASAQRHGMWMGSMGHRDMGHMQAAGQRMAMEMAMPMDPADGLPMPAGHDGAVCDYCVLAAALLPFVLLLLILPPLEPALGRLFVHHRLPRLRATWSAHTARGPPLQA